MRSRKLKSVAKQFDQFTAVIETDPAGCRGAWGSRHLPNAREVRLDLGCGKGSFAMRAAAAEPDVLFVGMDRERGCVAMAAKRALELDLPNVIFAQGDAGDLAAFFAPGELDLIYLNFCTPFTQAKQAPKRLTYVDHLLGYRDVLKPRGAVRFKTDSAPLFDFSRTQFDLAGYQTQWVTTDLHATHPDEIRSDYEEMLTAKGASIHALYATVGPRPERCEPTMALGLASYLPDDLDSMDYIPYGMEMTVLNMKNRRAKLREHARRAARGGESGERAE